MTTQQGFALPDVGEGLTEAEVLRWHVRPGDVVEVNQPIVEIETAKASVELPSPYAGTVVELHVEPGSIVPVGTVIITFETPDRPAAGERQPVLVGYGVREETTVGRRPRRSGGAAASNGHAEVTASNGHAEVVVRTAGPVLAKPPVRHLARELGVDLQAITPTGRQGEVTRDDVLAARPGSQQPAPRTPAAPSISPAAGERVPVRGVQRAMADAMVQSAFTAPHVTEWLDVDMSRALTVLERLRSLPQCEGVRLTPMLLVAAGLVHAARREPMINATWVDESDGPHVVLHPQVHLGIAADTPRGLLVPVVKGASDLGLLDLARAIQSVVDSARAGTATPADLTGGTITLTNIGVFGIDGGTPILSPGQVGILAMGRILDRAWVVDGSVVPRPVMQLSLSFDHRVVDGARGSRVLQAVAQYLADPALGALIDRGL